MGNKFLDNVVEYEKINKLLEDNESVITSNQQSTKGKTIQQRIEDIRKLLNNPSVKNNSEKITKDMYELKRTIQNTINDRIDEVANSSDSDEEKSQKLSQLEDIVKKLITIEDTSTLIFMEWVCWFIFFFILFYSFVFDFFNKS